MTDLMSLRDIAALAQVQRPVVTVWRKRARGTSHPFPVADQRRNGQEFFRRDDVVEWLERTRRGNNADARIEAASHTLLAGDSAQHTTALSAMLALRHQSGSSVGELSADELLDLADGLDPDDEYFRGELEPIRDLTALAQRTEELVEAAWGDQGAHRRVVDALRARRSSNVAQSSLTDGSLTFLLSLFGPLAREVDAAEIMDPTGCSVDLVADIARALELPVLLMDGSSAEHRLTRRDLMLADQPFRTIRRDDGDWSVSGPVAHLLVLPAVDAPAATSAEQLRLIDEVALQLDSHQVALCVAPAATLTESLGGEVLRQRDELLRAGQVRAIVRLPAGFRAAQAREHYALWVLGAADFAPPAERRVMVGDLAAMSLRECAGLADDLTAAWQGVSGAQRRAWAHLYPVFTRDLISASSDLVPARPARRGPRPQGSPNLTSADWVMALRTSDAAVRLAGFNLAASDGRPEQITLGHAVDRGMVRLIPGRRIDLEGAPAGAVRVWDGPTDAPQRSVDRLALFARTDVELTEPGDIIFAVHPKPWATVDSRGGALVIRPARILRLRDTAPLVTPAVAARINQARGSDWRAWTVALVADSQREVFHDALTQLAEQRMKLTADLAALDDLTSDLITAVESGQLTITKENDGAPTH